MEEPGTAFGQTEMGTAAQGLVWSVNVTLPMEVVTQGRISAQQSLFRACQECFKGKKGKKKKEKRRNQRLLLMFIYRTKSKQDTWN